MDTLPRSPIEHRLWWSEQTGAPYGTCWCGCGEPTAPAGCSNSKKFQVIGCPKRYVHGHQRRAYVEEYVVADLGYETPCWVSQRSKNTDGYSLTTVDGRKFMTHRLSYEKARGRVSDGLRLDHLCVSRTLGAGGSRACINPDHLEPVTVTENNRRSIHTKLAATDAKAMRALYENGTHTHQTLSEMFGVSRGHVGRILKGKAWVDA